MNNYRDLMLLEGIPGHENNISNKLINHIKKYKSFKLIRDNLGSVFAFKKGSSEKTLMIAGHMDEVGFIITNITENGFLKIQPLGGVDPSILIGLSLNIHTEKRIFTGYIGAIPPHLRKKQNFGYENIMVDVGAKNKLEINEMGIQLGDFATFIPYYKELSKDRIIAKSVDNRFGVGLAMNMISKLDKIDLPYNIAIGATVQEEVGLRGAETSVNTIKPDVFIALDASPVDDLDGKSDYSLGKGFLLRMYDPRNTMPEYLKNALVNLANKNEIKFQYYISKGGTDAAKALDMFDGVVSTTIGLPARYIHSPLAVFDTNDLRHAEKFLLTFIMNLDENKILLLKNGDFNVF